MTTVATPQLDRLDVDFELSDTERQDLEAALARITVNPYKHYPTFMAQAAAVAASGDVPQRFADFARSLNERDRDQRPTFYVKNAPIDHDVPVFDYDEPVQSKYAVKTTFVAEAFLAVFAELRGTPPIGYINVNDGDVFQDIYPKRSMQTSQSQKALQEIHFHKDLANHFVRPDHVYMLGMRSTPDNEVYTSFVRNIDVIERFSEQERALLRQPVFHTPFDDLTVAGAKALGDADKHPILSGDYDIRFFENRTEGTDDASRQLVTRMGQFLHESKKRAFLAPGDFVGVFNNHTVHAKEVVSVRDPEALKTRWIIKTVNVDDLSVIAEHVLPGTDHLVDG